MKTEFQTNMSCPRCNDQGKIIMGKVNATGQTIFVCDECEATWFAIEQISAAQFVDFGSFMKDQGLTGLWSEITIVERESGAA